MGIVGGIAPVGPTLNSTEPEFAENGAVDNQSGSKLGSKILSTSAVHLAALCASIWTLI